MSQSPIRLHALDEAGHVDALPLLEPLKVFANKYGTGSYAGVFQGDPGHANFVLNVPGPQVEFRGVAYELKKIHIHGKSEHVIEQDDPCDLEVHLIHVPMGSPVESPLVVIGILFKRSTAKKGLPSLRAMQMLSKGVKTKSSCSVEPLSFFPLLEGAAGSPDTVNWFHYEGSLTSYPYKENVSWIVMKSPSFIHERDIKPFVDGANQHPRELQPLDRRLVVRSFR